MNKSSSKSTSWRPSAVLTQECILQSYANLVSHPRGHSILFDISRGEIREYIYIYFQDEIETERR